MTILAFVSAWLIVITLALLAVVFAVLAVAG